MRPVTRERMAFSKLLQRRDEYILRNLGERKVQRVFGLPGALQKLEKGRSEIEKTTERLKMDIALQMRNYEQHGC